MSCSWDDFVVDFDARRVTGPEGSIHVEPQVFDVLEYLIRHNDRVVPKAELLDEVWGDQFVSESALTTRIKQVRQALGDDGRKQRYIRNVHGRGYQFVGELGRGPGAPLAAPRAPAPAVGAEQDLAASIGVDDEFRFVGRSAEMEQALAGLEAGRTGATEIQVVGSAGSGKSRFAVEVLRRAAADGAIVSAGRCESAMTSGLQPLRDAMGQLARVHPQQMAEWARGYEGVLVSLIPSLVDIIGGDPVPVDSYAGVDLLMAVLDRMAEQAPVVILVDDYQWSDELTRTMIGRIGRRLTGRPITTVLTRRTGGDVDSGRDGAGRFRHPNRIDVELGPLDPDAVRDLVGSVVAERGGEPDTDDVEQLLSLTSGQCLFLTESLRDLQQGQDTAESVVELIKARLERQPNDVQRMIVAGAVLGPEFGFEVAAATAGLAPGEGLDAVSQALDVELLHETSSPSRFRFSHQLVPEAIVGGLSRSRRCRMELACVEALTAVNADDVEIAFHRVAAVPLIPVDEVVAAARAAAVGARRAKQYDRAIRLLDRTLEVEPPARDVGEINLMIGELLVERGTPGEALDRLDHVIEIARANGWPDLFCDATLAYWGQSPYRKPHDRATLELLTEADELLGSGRSVRKARLLAKTAVFNIFRLPLSERDAMTAEALAMIDELDASPDDRLDVLEARSITFTCPAGADELEELDPQIAVLRAQLGVYFADAAVPESRAYMKGLGAEFSRVTEGDASRIAAQPIAEWRDLVLRSTLAAFDGDLATARDLSDRGAEIGDAFWGESAIALHGFSHFILDLLSGDWSRSRDLLELLMAYDGSPIFHAPLALARLEAGDRDGCDEARSELDLDRVARFGEHILGGNSLVALAELALRLDDDELAGVSATAMEPYSGLMMGMPWAAFSLAAADPLSRLAARRGDVEDAHRLRRQAAVLYRGLDAPYLLDRLDAL